MADDRDITERLEDKSIDGAIFLRINAAMEIRALRHHVARLEGDLAIAEDAVEHLRRYSSKQALDIVTLGQEVGRLREDLQVQANAVRMLDQCQNTEISHLRQTHQQAKTAAQTLDSEREANSLLTAENERLREALTKTYHELFAAIHFRGYEGGPLSKPSAKLAERIARAALAEKEEK